jgi:uncharacterized protein involved in exopolysaccharide biosynthesis
MMHKRPTPGSGLSRIWPIDDHAAQTADEGPVALLRAIIAVALRHKFKLILWTAFCIGVAALYARSVPPTYVATASLLLEPRRQALTSAREVTAPPALDLNRADSELQIIRSERLLAAVFKSLALENHAELQPQPPGMVRQLLTGARDLVTGPPTAAGAPPPSGGKAGSAMMAEASTQPGSDAGAARAADATEELRQIAFLNFANRLSARRVGQSYVIEIAYSSSDPALAARVANAAASAYLLQSVEFKADAAASGAEFLQGRLDSLSTQVRAASEAVKLGTLPGAPTPDADARIIGAALPPLGPSAPRSNLLVALGGVLGLMSGFFAVAIGGVLERKIRTAEGLARDTGLTCLASVPEASRWNRLSRYSDAEMDAMVISRSGSDFAAAIRNLRTSIEMATSSSRGSRNLVIAFATWREGSGNTLLSMNLAHLICRGGSRVTVLQSEPPDLDDPPATASLVDLIVGNAGAEQIVFSDLDGPAVLPILSADPQLNHFVDFCAPSVARILEFARSKGDVLLDLPPLGSSADALALAQHADAIIITVAAGRASAEEIDATLRSLRRIGANVIGAVLNRAGS